MTEGIGRGAGIYVSCLFESPQILNNVISNNRAVSTTDPGEGEGGGLYVEVKNASIVIAENLIEMNDAVQGGGIWSRSLAGASVLIQRNVIQFNDAENGAAIRSMDFTLSSTTIVNNLVRGNGSAAGVNDCDDQDDTRSPDLPELCNDGIDNDCNPATPDIFDADSDSFTCDLDCDDSDKAVSPAAVENCLDQIDNDCDGAIDRHNPDNVVLIEQGSSMVYLDNSADPGLGLTWVDPSFVDSSWTAGVYGVGFENAPPGAENLTTTVQAEPSRSDRRTPRRPRERAPEEFLRSTQPMRRARGRPDAAPSCRRCALPAAPSGPTGQHFRRRSIRSPHPLAREARLLV